MRTGPAWTGGGHGEPIVRIEKNGLSGGRYRLFELPARAVAWTGDIRYPAHFHHINAQLHLVRFWAGDYIEEAGGTDQRYLHLGITYLF